MKFVLFYHSLVSDWNHGNAHFLRGVASELIARGHEVEIYEPEAGWSLRQLIETEGQAAAQGYRSAYPELHSHFYRADTLDVEAVLEGADVVLVHEWNEPELVARIGRSASRLGCTVLFHDTHHRSVTDPNAMSAMDLRHYDGVLAFGQAIAERYVEKGWADRVWVWHEAADTRRFKPLAPVEKEGDLVWIGNWGDDERSDELREFLIDPVAQLQLRSKIHGVRYPSDALDALRAANIEYGGWIANYQVPAVFARYACTVHVPRRAYAQSLPGIPTIRMFEALACGIPLVSAPWSDSEHLFRPGQDYLVARNGEEMRECLRALLADSAYASRIAASGLETLLSRHTCAHRVDELLAVIRELDAHAMPLKGTDMRAGLTAARLR
ncbi:MAG: glycosyltransferase [Povalibacter sp.]